MEHKRRVTEMEINDNEKAKEEYENEVKQVKEVVE